MKVPEISMRLLAESFALLPAGNSDRGDPYFQEIVQLASRLWHGVREHPLLAGPLSRLPKPDSKDRRIPSFQGLASLELLDLAESLFPDVFAKCA